MLDVEPDIAASSTEAGSLTCCAGCSLPLALLVPFFDSAVSHEMRSFMSISSVSGFTSEIEAGTDVVNVSGVAAGSSHTAVVWFFGAPTLSGGCVRGWRLMW